MLDRAAFSNKEQLLTEAVSLYKDTEGVDTTGPLREETTARAAVERMLRNNAEAYTRADSPSGCMIVLARSQHDTANDHVRTLLAGARANSLAAVEARIERGDPRGDVPTGTDVVALAGCYVSGHR
ncbi:MAG: TetR family transcriptional regulator C-terminal domain-containing protein [Propionibacteriaceae bacterium]